MRIIIVGCGKVGYRLADTLSDEKHDVTVIDSVDSAINSVSDSLDVLCIKGNGASISVLKNAGVERADVVIAATDRDETNMICCIAAKRLGARYTIARIRDFEYSKEYAELTKQMDIDLVVNPEQETAELISRLLRFPSAFDIDSFFRGRVELVGFRIAENDTLANIPLIQLRKTISVPILFCAVRHENETIIPNGSTVFCPGDKVYIIGSSVDINSFFRSLGKIPKKIKSVFIAGGGRLPVYLSNQLASMNIGVTLIEREHENCLRLCELLPKAVVLNGDATDHELLLSENLQNAGAFLALTGDDEDNILAGLYAKKVGVPHVIAKVNRTHYYDIIDSLNIDSAVSPAATTASTIVRAVRALSSSHGSRMEALYRIADETAEAMEFVVAEDTRYLNIPLRDIHIRHGFLIGAIVRGGTVHIPEGNDHIEVGDTIIVVSAGSPINDLNSIFND